MAASSPEDLKEARKPPDGVESLFLTATTLKIVGLEGGSPDTPLKAIDLKVILDDIQFRGAISDFHCVREKLKKLGADTVLIRQNIDDPYGDGNNFEVCVTTAGRAALEKEREDELSASAAAAAAEDVAAIQEKADKQRPAEWVCLGSDREIEEATVKLTRDLIAMSISRRRREFGGLHKLSDKDAQELWNSSQMECRPFKDPSFEKKRMEYDEGVQAVPDTCDVAVQAGGARPRNNAVQYTPQDLEAEEKERLLQSEEMRVFLQGIAFRYEEALQQNEVMDIFADDFASLAEDDGGMGNKSANTLSEYQSFTDLTYSKNKIVSAIDWLPNRKGVVAVACIEPFSLDERLDIAGRVRNSAVLIWNFVDPIHPQFVLESPSDVYALRFNPQRPEIIAGGCYNGQVIVWDTSSLQEQMLRRERRMEDEDKDTAARLIPVIKHHMLSHVDASHSMMVNDLHWLPNHMDIDGKGRLTQSKQAETNMFATIAADGKVMFWDIRKHARKKVSSSPSPTPPIAQPEELPWVPTFEIRLSRMESTGHLGALRMDLSRLASGSTLFYCGSEDGEVIHADLRPSSDGQSEQVEHVRLVGDGHSGPIRALQRSPFFEDMILSASDWTFKIWVEGTSKPIFAAHCADTYISCACWSPSRPGVILAGLQDGTVHVWDLLDRSHEPSMIATVSSAPISAIEFCMQSVPQLLAVGDATGVLHILELPRNLRRPLHKEKAVMKSFFDRECARVSYVAQQEKAREAELAARRQQAAVDQGGELLTSTEVEVGYDDKMEAEYQRLEKAFRAKLGVEDTAEGLPKTVRLSTPPMPR